MAIHSDIFWGGPFRLIFFKISLKGPPIIPPKNVQWENKISEWIAMYLKFPFQF